MTKLQALTRIYETLTEAWLPCTGDESNTERIDPFPRPSSIDPFPRPSSIDPDDYARVQREFGWDDIQ